MRNFYTNNKYFIDKLVVVIAITLFMVLFFQIIFPYVSPFVFGLLLSLILNPAALYIARKFHISKGIAAFLSIVILLFILALLFNLLFSKILAEAREFLQNFPEIIQYVENTVTDLNTNYDNLHALLPEVWDDYFLKLLESLSDGATSMVGDILKTGSTAFVSKIPNFILSFVLGLLSCFFFIKDRELIGKSISAAVPGFLKKYAAILKNGIIDAVFGYIKAQGILMCIVAVICFVGLSILKVEYALFLSLLIAVVDALPVFGSGFFYWPWAGFSFITGNYSMAIGLIIVYIIVLFTRQILEPKILGTQIGIHPLLTLMSIYVGLQLFGVFGIFIGPCIVVIIKTLVMTNPEETLKLQEES